jgi:energy-coupling factor transporter ATP-binding protein EcfA2
MSSSLETSEDSTINKEEVFLSQTACRVLRMGRHIVISGADGSGKTTVVRLLASYFSSQGSICTHWFRGSHLLASLLYRLLSRFRSFRGYCNPYYGVCVPVKLRPLWVHVEFWSLIPHVIVRLILRRFCRVLVCDRGFMDFIVWVVVTLGHPSFLSSIYGRFLIRLTALEGPVYLYADVDTLAGRADVPRSFIARELIAYNMLARCTSRCSIDTGRRSPQAVVKEILSCLGTREGKSSTKA